MVAAAALLRTVIVNLHDESTAVRGVLWQSRGAWLVLKDPALLRGGEHPQTLDGEVHIPRTNVSFVQVVP